MGGLARWLLLRFHSPPLHTVHAVLVATHLCPVGCRAGRRGRGPVLGAVRAAYRGEPLPLIGPALLFVDLIGQPTPVSSPLPSGTRRRAVGQRPRWNRMAVPSGPV